jgi:hypothetical protein
MQSKLGYSGIAHLAILFNKFGDTSTPDTALQTTPDNSRQLQTTPDNSRQLQTTPDNSRVLRLLL